MFRIIVAGLCLVAPILAEPNSGAPANCVLNEKRPNPANPQTFYHCRAEGPVLMKCMDNMVFESAAMDCVKTAPQNQAMNNVSVARIPANTAVWSPPPPPPPTPAPSGWSNPPPPPSGWSNPPTPPPSGWSPTTPAPITTTTGKPMGPIGACPEVDSGWGWATYLPDEDDCHYFYECSNGTPYQFVCPSDLYWNAFYDYCGNDYQGYIIFCGENRKRNLAAILKTKSKGKGKDKN